MEADNADARKNISKYLTDLVIRIGLIAFMVIMSVRIFSPFMGMMLWALILAVTLYPLHQKIARRTGGKPGRAATIVVLLGILLIGVPTAMLGISLADFVQHTHSAFQSNTITIEQPAAEVADWPVIGSKVFKYWTLAANDLPALLETLQPQLGNFSKAMLGFVAGTASGIFQFLFSLIIAGIMMAYGQSGSEVMSRILCRITGRDNGVKLHALSTATIRSVSMGVIGVAFIQALLMGVGFAWADIPAAGLLAFITLLFGIAQLPAAIISLPVIGYLWWSGDSTLINVVWTVYFLIAGMVDGVLKPLMLGRGVEAPMPIILLGALGGMVAGGMIGLFVGAVFLTLGYVIFMDWVGEQSPEDSEDSSDTLPASDQPA